MESAGKTAGMEPEHDARRACGRERREVAAGGVTAEVGCLWFLSPSVQIVANLSRGRGPPDA